MSNFDRSGTMKTTHIGRKATRERCNATDDVANPHDILSLCREVVEIVHYGWESKLEHSLRHVNDDRFRFRMDRALTFASTPTVETTSCPSNGGWVKR
jgi:hypothetical protein